MANPKYHWAIQIDDTFRHRNAWKGYAGGRFVQACGRKKKSAVGYSAERFAAKVQRNPDWYCSDCAKAARLALAAESAPKPDPRCDSERYAELRKLVELWQSHTVGSSQALADWRHR